MITLKFTLFARLCQIYMIKIFTILILSRTKRKMDARGKNLIGSWLYCLCACILVGLCISESQRERERKIDRERERERIHVDYASLLKYIWNFQANEDIYLLNILITLITKIRNARQNSRLFFYNPYPLFKSPDLNADMNISDRLLFVVHPSVCILHISSAQYRSKEALHR